jgi:hypothetical protein
MSDHERAARYSDLFAAPDHEHAPDCAYCPICATIGVLRNTHPEVLEHLATAARELMIAAGLMLEEAESFVATSSEGTPARGGKSKDGVRRVDLD